MKKTKVQVTLTEGPLTDAQFWGPENLAKLKNPLWCEVEKQLAWDKIGRLTIGRDLTAKQKEAALIAIVQAA